MFMRAALRWLIAVGLALKNTILFVNELNQPFGVVFRFDCQYRSIVVFEMDNKRFFLVFFSFVLVILKFLFDFSVL